MGCSNSTAVVPNRAKKNRITKETKIGNISYSKSISTKPISSLQVLEKGDSPPNESNHKIRQMAIANKTVVKAYIKEEENDHESEVQAKSEGGIETKKEKENQAELSIKLIEEKVFIPETPSKSNHFSSKPQVHRLEFQKKESNQTKGNERILPTKEVELSNQLEPHMKHSPSIENNLPGSRKSYFLDPNYISRSPIAFSPVSRKNPDDMSSYRRKNQNDKSMERKSSACFNSHLDLVKLRGKMVSKKDKNNNQHRNSMMNFENGGENKPQGSSVNILENLGSITQKEAYEVRSEKRKLSHVSASRYTMNREGNMMHARTRTIIKKMDPSLNYFKRRETMNCIEEHESQVRSAMLPRKSKITVDEV